jgi:hypothetical protein
MCMLSPGACIIKLITAVINSVKHKSSVFVKASKKMTDNIKGTSLLHYGINYGHKKFYDTDPGEPMVKVIKSFTPVIYGCRKISCGGYCVLSFWLTL